MWRLWGSALSRSLSVRFGSMNRTILNYLPVSEECFMITLYLQLLRLLSPLLLTSDHHFLFNRAELHLSLKFSHATPVCDAISSLRSSRHLFEQRISPKMMATTWRTRGVVVVFCALTVVTTFVNKVFRFFFGFGLSIFCAFKRIYFNVFYILSFLTISAISEV